MGKTKRPIVEISCLKTIQEICMDGLLEQHINVVYSPPGYGKTIALEVVQNSYPENIILITALLSMTPRRLFSRIINAVLEDKYDHRTELYTMIQRAATLLNNQDKNTLVIIDEVSRLSPNFFLHIHDFRNLTKNKVGIILAGGNYFQERLNKWSEKSSTGIPEFLSRVYSFVEIEPCTNEEKIGIINANGIYDSAFEEFCCVEATNDLRKLEAYITSYPTIKKKLEQAQLKLISS